MSYEKALEILIELMIENKDVLLRLKKGEDDDNEEWPEFEPGKFTYDEMAANP